jgi:hypothetical protein
MCALRECMNSCVGSTGAVHSNGLAADALKRALKMILNRIAMRLTLPTGERSSVVRDGKL